METIKKLKIKGLHLVVTKVSSFRYCTLMATQGNIPLKNYSSKPIHRFTDFVKLLNEGLSDLDWEVTEYTDEHRNAIFKIESKLLVNDSGYLVVKN